MNFIFSNWPIEDDHAEAILRSPSGSPWHFWTVIDGHVGWETSAALAERLIPSVSGALQGLYSRRENPSSEAINSAIKDAFISLDNDFVYTSVEKALDSGSRKEAAQLLSQAWAGAVALLAFYDQARGEVKVALTGDLRAVRGRRSVDGKWETKVLTVEQDGDNEEEADRIRREHPGEPDVVKDGRVLGWQPSRAFGDAGMKWSLEIQRTVRDKFLGGRRISDKVKTPPYLTAEPVITTTDVKDGDFLILGCDGLWECLTSQEAVALVGQWVDVYGSKDARSVNEDVRSSSKKYKVNVSSSAPSGTREKTIAYEEWKIPKQFVMVDDNVATHLIRNSLGGADKETMAALLTRTGGLARRLRCALYLNTTDFCTDDSTQG
jgi:pyruvate dehydrogenase phosphatase